MASTDVRIERILVRGPNWIGDAVMSTPALQRLRNSFPDSHITLLATALTAGLFEESPYFNEIIEYRRRESGAKVLIETSRKIRAHQFDLAVLFQNAFEAALLAWIGGARLRIGFSEQGRGILLTGKLYRHPQLRDRHQIHDYLEIVAECERVCFGQEKNTASGHPLPVMTATHSQLAAARALLLSSGIDPGNGPLIALNPGATNSRAKCWGEAHFASLADRLIGELNGKIVLIGAPSERDIAERVFKQIGSPGVINLAGKTSIQQLVGLLDHCHLLVSNDTGPAHIAAALGRPTLTIFGPTNEFETAPLGLRAEMLRAEGIECARCMLRDCPIDHRCMSRITADDAFNRAATLLRAEEITK
jgi:heptosyltransferase II